MPLAKKSSMTAKGFLDWVDSLEEDTRYELLSGEPVAMSPERNRYNLLKTACWRAMDNGVRDAGLTCIVLGDGASVIVCDNDVYEPDVTIQCDKAIDLDATTVPSPIVVVEVLSPSTKGVDAGGKLFGYLQLASIQHYLMIDPAKQVLIHHYRVGNEVGTAILQSGRIQLDPPGFGFDISDCFVGVR